LEQESPPKKKTVSSIDTSACIQITTTSKYYQSPLGYRKNATLIGKRDFLPKIDVNRLIIWLEANPALLVMHLGRTLVFYDSGWRTLSLHTLLGSVFFSFDIHSFRSIVLKWESLIRKSISSRLGIGIYICNLNGIEARDCEELFFSPVRFGLGKEEGVLLLRELVSKLHVFCQTYVFGKKKTKKNEEETGQ
jgi:hypothetical protein